MKQIPMLDLHAEYMYMKPDIDAAIQRCLDHQKWILGPEVKELESVLAGYLGVKHTVGVSSGTEALVIALRAFAIKLTGREFFGPSDRIITTPLTFTATGDAILRSGATPVFIDIDPVTLNIDAAKVREYLSCNQSGAAGIIPVHLYGQACDMDSILQLAEEYGLFVLEDVAQAFGGMWKEKKLGSIGTAAAFSFFPSKNLGSFGDAGMISTNDHEISELARQLLKHGGKDKFDVEHIGYNARLDTIQAAVLLAKFKYIDELNEKRRAIAEMYSSALEGNDDLALTFHKPGSLEQSNRFHVYHQYTFRVLNGKRDGLKKHLQQNGIDTMIYYLVPLHKMKVFQGKMTTHGALNVTELATDEILSLPVGPLMGTDDVLKVISGIRNFCNI